MACTLLRLLVPGILLHSHLRTASYSAVVLFSSTIPCSKPSVSEVLGCIRERYSARPSAHSKNLLEYFRQFIRKGSICTPTLDVRRGTKRKGITCPTVCKRTFCSTKQSEFDCSDVSQPLMTTSGLTWLVCLRECLLQMLGVRLV